MAQEIGQPIVSPSAIRTASRLLRPVGGQPPVGGGPARGLTPFNPFNPGGVRSGGPVVAHPVSGIGITHLLRTPIGTALPVAPHPVTGVPTIIHPVGGHPIMPVGDHPIFPVPGGPMSFGPALGGGSPPVAGGLMR